MDLIEHQTKNDPRVAAKVEYEKVFGLHIHFFLFSFLGEILFYEDSILEVLV
jgi:hypothetical protein